MAGVRPRCSRDQNRGDVGTGSRWESSDLYSSCHESTGRGTLSAVAVTGRDRRIVPSSCDS